MEIRVLGPVEVWSADTSVHLARRQQRLLLGILALEANHVLSCDRLIDLVWSHHPPRRARAVVQSRISELRAVLHESLASHDGHLLTQGNSYVLRLPLDLVDAHQFRQLVAQAHDSGEPEDQRLAFRRALGLWRGPALGGWLPSGSHAALCQGLESARLTTMEDLFDVELRLDRHQSIVDEAQQAAAANPTRERLTSQAMLALHLSGRTGEALQVYERCRRWLASELGVDPARDLQDLHLALLRGDTNTAVVDAQASGSKVELAQPGSKPSPDAEKATTPAGFEVAVPRTLPSDVLDFTGRAKEVALLADLLTQHIHDGVAVAVVSGPAGVGKTALCVFAAHRLRGAFPDGQLFANLRGVELDGRAEPFDILGRFLRALGMDGFTLPTTLDDRVDQYRGLLAERRVLVVLDNAESAEQVLPLIPGGATCTVLINSRTRLSTALSAEVISLGVLDPPQAIDLLSRIAGAARIGAEPDAAAELARLCGYLPLAMRVAAAKLVTKPHWSVERLAERLGDERNRLNYLSYGHLDVRSSIALSVAGLPLDGQRLLRRLGDIDMPEVNVWVSAALLDTTVAEAEEILEQLHDAQLVDIAGHDPTGHARYKLHDLVRLLAKEQATADEQGDELEAAQARALGAWLAFAEALHRAIYGGDYQNIHSPAVRWPIDEHLMQPTLAADPVGWFESERPTIIAMIGRASRDNRSALCWGLACTVSPLIEMRRHFDEWQSILDLAHATAVQSNDDLGQAAVCYRLGMLHADRQEFDDALDRFRVAGELFSAANHRHGQATVVAYQAMIERFQGEQEAALITYERSLPGLRQHGDLGGEAFALRGMGQIYLDRDDQPNADAYLANALKVARRASTRPGLAQVLYWQGVLRMKQQRLGEAQLIFTEVLEAVRVLGDRVGEAQTLRGLGLCYHRQGDTVRARATLTEALRLVRQPRPTLLESHIQRAIAEL